MPYTDLIDDEARILSKYSNDLDNFRRLYSIKEETSNETILVQFVAPKIIAFEDYRFVLLQNSRTELLQPSKYFRPDYVSFDEYGTPNLWALIMFINNVPTMEDFILENILIPSETIVSKIALDVLNKKLLTEIVPLTDYPLPPTSPLFYRQKTLPTFKTETPVDTTFRPTDMYFYRESFTIDVVTARQRYVDLEYEAVPESIVLKIKDKPNYLYSKHYSLIKGTKGNNRITWDPRKITNGIGLMSVLVEGTEFEISYARKVLVS
jgi:hypothetical protein